MRSPAPTWNQIPIRPDRSPNPVPTEIYQFPSITIFCRYKMWYSLKTVRVSRLPGKRPARNDSSLRKMAHVRQLCGLLSL